MNLQAQSNNKNTSGKFSWNAISNIIGRLTGQSFDYESFQNQYDNDPTQKLQHIVADFNEHGLTLNVKNKENSDVGMQPSTDKGIDSSAIQAANKTLKRNRG